MRTNSDIAYNSMLEMISNRLLLPGQKLNESDLSNQLEMSRTPVREALRRLQNDGLIEIIPNKGAFVKSFSLLEMAYGYEIVSMLTGMACKHISMNPEKISNSSFSDLYCLTEKMEDALQSSDKQTWVNLDIEFHKGIIDLADIWQLSNTYSHLVVWINQVLWHITPIYVNLESSNNDHRKILKLLKGGHSKEAQEFSQSHQMKTVNIIRSLSERDNKLMPYNIRRL